MSDLLIISFLDKVEKTFCLFPANLVRRNKDYIEVLVGLEYMTFRYLYVEQV